MALTPAFSDLVKTRRAFRHFRPSPSRSALVLACVLAAGGLAAPASAASDASTKLIRCGRQSCLLVSGHRDDPSAVISINGQPVSVEGQRSWRISVPVDTVRQWSAPYAREIEVSFRDPGTQRESADIVDLPIGLLGNVTDLASLEISLP